VYKPGERIKLVVSGTLKVGNVEITDSTLAGVTIVRQNPDGSYQVDLRPIMNSPELASVRVPAAWLQPL
jgi:hypothetical protein